MAKIRNKHRISLIIHTKNEEKNIKDCITSAKAWVDEIVVIDMQSTDNTKKIARKLGAKVYSHKDVGFADPSRNFGIKKAKHSWIFSLDADERLHPALGRKIRKLVNQDDCDLVKIPHKNIMLGKWIKYAGWWPDYHPRLFRKGALVYYDKPHTEARMKGKLILLPAKEENAIIHYGHETVGQILENYKTYSALEDYYQENEGVKDITDVIKRAEAEFSSRYFDAQGYKEGLRGYILSKLREFYRYLEFFVYWERQGFPDIISKNKLHNQIKEINSIKQKAQMYEEFSKSTLFIFWNNLNKVKNRIIGLLRRSTHSH